MRSYDEITPEWCEQNKVVWWGDWSDDWPLRDSIDDTIEAMLDDADPVPKTIEVTAYRRMKLPHTDAQRIVEDILEHLDEELGDPEGETTSATPEMLAAAEALIRVIEGQYVPLACEDVETFEVDVPKWIAANRPEWLGLNLERAKKAEAEFESGATIDDLERELEARP